MRSAVFVLAAAAVALLLAAQEGPHAGPAIAGAAIQGDADCSGAIDPVDSLRILKHDAGQGATSCAEAADTNCDDSINPVDALRILRFDAGLPLAAIQGCAPIGEPLEELPASTDLIDAALAAGDIDEETALIYRVYSTFGDERLPGQYAGGGPSEYDEGVMYEAAQALPTMSDETQDLLAPFMIPPYSEQSWLNQGFGIQASEAGPAVAPAAGDTVPCPNCPSGHWKTIVAVPGKARVWWQERFPSDEAKAQLIADALAGGIWAKETTLLGREPLNDAGETLPHGIDGMLDIYFVDLGDTVGGRMTPYWFSTLTEGASTGGCNASANFILVNRAEQDYVTAVTHELFHSVQVAFNGFSACDGMHWLLESTAVWAEDFVAPAKNNEHNSFAYFSASGVALDVPADRAEKYGRYAFFLWATRTFGDPLMKQIWTNAESSRPIKAIDDAIPGGLAAHWHEFALAFWNRPPVETLKQMDGIMQGASPRGLESDAISAVIDVSLAGKETVSLTPELGSGQYGLERVSTDYYHFRLLGDGSGDEIASVTFFNPFFERQGVHMQALVKTGGQWTTHDWTADQSTSYCRQQPAKKVEEVVLIFSNSDTVNGKSADASRPLVEASKDCGWTGTATVVRTDVCSFDCDVTEDCSGCGEITWTGVATDLVFLPASDQTQGADQFFDLAKGKISWSVSGHYGDCNVSGGNAISIPAGKGRLRVTPQEGGGIEYALYGYTEVTFQYQDCNGTVSRQVGIWLCSGGAHDSSNESIVSGAYHWESPGASPPACPTAGSSPAGLSSNERDFSWNLHR